MPDPRSAFRWQTFFRKVDPSARGANMLPRRRCGCGRRRRGMRPHLWRPQLTSGTLDSYRGSEGIVTVPRTKGYRRITVAGRPFRWRFRNGIVVVPDGSSGRQVLEVDLGWIDHFLRMKDFDPAATSHSPKVATTPSFIASAIEFALQNGWNTDAQGGRFRLRYSAEKGFQVPADGALSNSALQSDERVGRSAPSRVRR